MTEIKKPRKKIFFLLRWIGWVLLAQFILINVSSFFYARKMTTYYTNVSDEGSSSVNIFSKTWKLFTGPKFSRSEIRDRPVFPYDTVSLETASGLHIDAWYSPADSNAKGTVILFHGITVCKEKTIQQANEFRYWGYNVMLVDFRGHGNSDGNRTTIGYKETDEVKLAYDHVKDKGEKNIFLFGISLGAVVVAKAVAEHNLAVSGIILEMPFLSLQSYLKAKARTLGFPQQPFAVLTTFWIGAQNGFNGYKHKTTRYVKKIQCPVLLQTGSEDDFVLHTESEKIYKAIGSANKKWVVYEKAGHSSLLNHDATQWRTEVSSFLGQRH